MKYSNRPVLSISILVSNRIDTIEKCMESIKPLLTELPSELIAIDTVGEGTDGSIDVVRKYTDKIYRFEWCNDFAAARNAGLMRACGEWFMFMDDDEWFEDVGEIVEFFKSGEYKNYHCALYKVHNYANKEGAYSRSSVFRMIKIEKETKFVGQVHEHLVPYHPPVKEFSAYVHHYGYVFDSEEERRKHSERNLVLLRSELKKNPGSMHIRAQLVQEFMFLKELIPEAEKLCEDTFKASKESYSNANFQWILAAYARCASVKQTYEQSLERGNMLRHRFPLNEMADFAISYIEMEACGRLEQYERGVQVFEHALPKRKYVLENPEKRRKMLALDLENFIDDTVYCEFLKWGAYCYRKTGNYVAAEDVLKEYFKLLGRPVLTISVLVSNRIKTIRNCMESVKTLLDAVPSELIVVDTVGEENSDGSLAVAKEYATRIVPYEWDDNFAAARNAGLKDAKGDWFLYLDDDEWFESTEEFQKFITSGEYLEYSSATYPVRNYKDEEGVAYNVDIVGRMVRRLSTTTFVGCINEAFANLYVPAKRFSNYAHHYGFVYKTEEEKKQRLQYVRRLLEKDLTEYPDNLKNRATLTAVLAVENPAKAMEICIETLHVCQGKKQKSQYQGQISMLFELLEKLQVKAQIAEEQYNYLQSIDGMLPLAEQVVCYHMTRIMILQEDYQKAYLYAKRYFALDGIPTEQKTEMPQEVRKYQTAVYREEMLNLGGFCAWQTKEYGDAWECYEALSWETAGTAAEDSMWQLFTMAEECENADVLFRIINRIMRNGTLKPVLAKLMQNPVVKERINRTLTAQREKNGMLDA